MTRTSRTRTALVTLAAASALVLGGLQPAIAEGVPSAAPAAQPRVVLDVPSPQTIYEDNLTHVTGNLTNGKAGKLILLRKKVDGRWQRLASTRTVAGGDFSVGLRPVNPGRIWMQAVHRTGHGRIESLMRTVLVKDRRVYLFSNPIYHTFGNIVMTGTTRPAAIRRPIVIQHLVRGVWGSAARGFTDAQGHYAIQMRHNLPGPWTVRAYWAGSNPGGGTMEYSGVHRYSVQAILHPVVTAVTRAQLGGSYHDGCPVGPDLLRNVAVTFKTFGPTVARGTLVVRDTIVGAVKATLAAALGKGYPIRRMFPTAHYGGSDIASMNHDNTSAFNCRNVTGDPTRLSPHSYGIAIDVDTVENPYQDVHGVWWPKNIGQQFRDRHHVHLGMLYDSSLVTQSFKGRGFQWGGDWSHPDYQHFDTLGGGREKSAPAISGPLDQRSMPARAVLGAGWHRYADPGGAEAGWQGNGTFVHARNPAEAANGVLPLGCEKALSVASTVPGFALQGAYLSSDGRTAQAVVMQFAKPTAASAYFAGLERALTHCTTADGPSGVSISTSSATPTSYAGVRTYAGHEVWVEHDIRSGARVTVLLART